MMVYNLTSQDNRIYLDVKQGTYPNSLVLVSVLNVYSHCLHSCGTCFREGRNTRFRDLFWI